MCVELLTPSGNWSSYPPHRHDDSPECPVNNEEIYYFRVGRDGTTDYAAEGFGLHRTYTPEGDVDVNLEVRDGDVFCVHRGYHGPCVAAPGYPLYYLNVLAGPGGERSMAFCDDPAHHWVRAAWDGMAPRPALPDDDVRPAWPMRQPLGVGVVGFGWMGQAHSRSYRRIPTLFPDRVADPVLVVCADAVEARRRDAVEGFGFRRGDRRLAQGRRAPRRRRRRRHGAEHAPRRDRLGRRGGGQGGVLREAGRRHAGADRRRRAGRPSRRHRRRVQLPLGAARAVHQGARRRGSSRAGSRTTAAGSCRATATTRSACCRGASSSTRPATASAPTCSATPSTSRCTSSARSPTSSASARRSSASGRCPTGRRHPLRPRRAGRPDRTGHQRGLVRRHGPLRRRRGRHVRGVPLDDRSGEPARLRDLRHRRLGALEPGADERARGLPRPRRAAHRLHDGVRRRPLRRARGVRARAGPTASASRTS